MKTSEINFIHNNFPKLREEDLSEKEVKSILKEFDRITKRIGKIHKSMQPTKKDMEVVFSASTPEVFIK
ncbi:hypothetical protein BXY85_1679 [Roseivirga pacifica]|uniref:Uncharacterized protein n=1 Tax=Roseivirga pacifica TaxID=1267423 RepID=A0A1I0MSD2_9BACT|nr:hypothetical protein [Roseivirga pacifica]RKQ50662.1 hypothetical protein BXY85_1679 [Roseivirga pacifica]SEV91596.1 hypothetical protein SAMN05216290_0662 [Roseivirga pacifica]